MFKGRVVGVEGNRKEPQLSAFISVTHATRNSLLLFPSRTLDVPVVQLMDNTIFSGKGLFCKLLSSDLYGGWLCTPFE